jgi:hypothetical protein
VADGEGAQPSGIGQAVVVGEGQQRAARRRNAHVPGGRRPAVRRGQERERQVVAQGRQYWLKWETTAIIDDQHLKGRAVGPLVGQSSQAAQALGAPMRGHDHTDQGRLYEGSWCAASAAVGHRVASH